MGKITSLVITVVAGYLASLIFYQPFFAVRLVQKFIPRITFYGNPDSNVFALTFDDGPLPPFTDQVLDILDQYNAKATFFLIGSKIEQYPHYVNNMRARGHQVANHTFYDQRTVFMKTESLIRSIRQTEKLIQQPHWPKFLRPGSGWIRPDQLDAIEAEGYHVVLGSAYVSDPLYPPRWYMQRALTSMLRPGAMVVLHDGIKDPTKTVAVLPALLEKARQRGLKAVTLYQLFNHRQRLTE